LVASLIPFNKRFFSMYKDKPDLYGPFWIYTTLIIIIAISGNLSRYFELGSNDFTYNYNFIPIAATVLYSMALGLPFALKFIMRLLGSNFFNGTFIEIVGIYGCSFTSFLITALICAVPI
jgi:protein YIPF1/2